MATRLAFGVFGWLFAVSGAVRAQEGGRFVHDPVVMEEKGVYYLYSTGRGIGVRISKDMLEWKFLGPVFEEPPEWATKLVPEYNGHTWAPDISKVGDKYFLYYSCSSFNSNHSAIGLATNTTLNPRRAGYKWEDQGMVVASQKDSDFNAIDPNLIRTDNGRYYLCWGSFWTGIKMTEISPTTGKPKHNPPKIISIAGKGQYKGGGGESNTSAIEAPFIFKHGDYYYQFTSLDLCCRGADSTYKIAVGRAEDVDGPYLDREGHPMREGGSTLLLAGYGDTVQAAGHCAVFTEDGKDWLFHHIYDKTRNYTSRLQIRPLLWTKDGWPVVGGEITAKERRGVMPQPKAMEGKWRVWKGFVEAGTLLLEPGGKGALGDIPCKWKLVENMLYLKEAEGEDALVLCLFAGAGGDWLSGRDGEGVTIYAERQGVPR